MEIIPVLGMEPSLRAMAARRIAAERDAELVPVHLGEGRSSDDVLREVVDGLLVGGVRHAVLDMGEEALTTEVIGAFAQLPQAYVPAVVAVVDSNDAIHDLTGEDYVVRMHDDGVGTFQVPRAVLLTSQLEYATTLILRHSRWKRPQPVGAGDFVLFARTLGPGAQILTWTDEERIPALRSADDIPRSTPGWLRVVNEAPNGSTTGYRRRGGIRVPGSRVRILHYRRERPFHPSRLLQCLEEGADWAPLLRVAGFTRIASRPGVLSLWEQTGVTISVDPYEADWWADRQSAAEYGIVSGQGLATGSDVTQRYADLLEYMEYGVAERWRVGIGPLPDIGDAVLGQDIVAIGVDLDVDRLERELDACLLTDEEFLDGVWVWMMYEDAFPE